MQEQYSVEKAGSGMMHFVMLSDADAKPYLVDGNKRVICRLNDEVEFHAALMPKKRYGYYINIGARICKQLNLKAGSQVKVALKIDTSEHQFEEIAEWKAVIDTDPEAEEVFMGLTDGNKRSLMYLVSQPKTSEKRIERALLIAERIKSGITSPSLVLKK